MACPSRSEFLSVLRARAPSRYPCARQPQAGPIRGAANDGPQCLMAAAPNAAVSDVELPVPSIKAPDRLSKGQFWPCSMANSRIKVRRYYRPAGGPCVMKSSSLTACTIGDATTTATRARSRRGFLKLGVAALAECHFLVVHRKETISSTCLSRTRRSSLLAPRPVLARVSLMLSLLMEPL